MIGGIKNCMNKELPKLPIRQKIYSKLCKALAGGRSEERTTNLLPEYMLIKGFRLWLYRYFSYKRYKLGIKLAKKYKTHQFRLALNPQDENK